VPAFRADTVAIDGEAVPLEVERTATLAYVLADSPVWKREMRGFLGQVSSDIELPQLVATEPHRPGLIPVAFVHGTASSPGRWAQMVNELMADPRIRDRFFFMFFFYDTGNPIAYSSMLLRDYLIEAVTGMDPTGSDPCAHEMVVIGHSQGGLLTKMTAVHTGDRLWHNISNEPIEETKLKPETREILQRALFVDPLPFVRKVVFVCTPHRGSFLARRRINDLISRLVHLPGTLLGVASDLMVTTAEETAFGKLERIPTSVDNMTPGSPFVQALSIIPTAPGVAAHSIIAVEGDGPIETGNDGVVAYESAHIDGVDSEVVVRSSHSVQANPEAIAEVKRILLEHAGRSACPH
jgi:pimeloyl-ACP methyl ester carboxylesterase